ncbi:d-dopachrome decarboxylase [Holotrichia oblita]|uniref:D-dopachrome decarboxylase n=3 Tax=Holotrichia oblita TaxID=644536 RepID=A0ACB9SGT5_HOLOL|nr:d-dopachrome decarboxylase [Holotrichia oblita]KAI4454327.1 d-dopachrome decarboxylase [Holotrichia oblita]KAI4454343.1 d-dopachrome decarboxylase [Holotrichia oblita]
MPHFRLETNVSADTVSPDLPKKICDIISSSLGKSLQYCVATVVPGVNMSWGGTNEPCAQATLVSIGALGVSENKQHSKAFFDLICTELQISPERMYIHYTDAPSSDIGYNYSTFDDILD